jgi:hypothetical protein
VLFCAGGEIIRLFIIFVSTHLISYCDEITRLLKKWEENREKVKNAHDYTGK